jgi:acyl carrier protein
MDSRDLSTAERIRSFIDEELMDDGPTEGDPLTNEALDSLAIEQLVSYIEDAFGVTFRDDEIVARNFASVPTLAQFVNQKLSAAGLSGA